MRRDIPIESRGVFNSELRMGGTPATSVHTRLVQWQMTVTGKGR